MKRKLTSILLALIMILSLLPSAVGCSVESVERIRRDPAPVEEYDFSETKAVEGPENGVAETIQYIRMDDKSNEDLFMMVSLQGNVNRSQASMYVIHDEMVEGSQLNASEYWFEKLDETYTGEEAFQYNEYTDPFEMLVDNIDAVKGAVLYNGRIVDEMSVQIGTYNQRYADIAVLNLTVMMCGQYDAVALTYAQYNKLKSEYHIELPVLGDTTLFMKTDPETGKLDSDRGSRDVWMQVYRYAHANFDVSENALVHNPGFQAATFDYAIAHRLFVYNRIFTVEATPEEVAMELAILNKTKANTPVLGVWYLQADEGGLVSTITQNYKYFIVSYESFNWSWTTGLPAEEMSNVEEKEIVLDPTKNYVSFNFTEGDNNSYVHFQMPLMYDHADRGEVPIGWTMAPTVWDTNPNIIRYFNQNWAEGDGLTVPEAGVDYVYFTPPEESRQEFFALSDEYMGRIGNGTVRVLHDDMVDPLPYAESMENLDSVLCGYYTTSFEAVNNDDKDSFLFRDKLFIKQIQGSVAADYLKSVQSSGPYFYSVSLYGWGQNPSTAKAIMDSIGDNFVAVTPTQLADLYRQYYESEFKDITVAEFDCGMTRSEMGFLYKATDYTLYDSMSSSRYAEGKGYMIYRFDLADAVANADFWVRVSGNYQIEVSNDYQYWYVMDKGFSSEERVVNFNAAEYIKDGEPLYVRIGTRDCLETSTAYCYGITMTTDQSRREIVKVEGRKDESVWVSGGTQQEEGRSGEFVYRLDLKEGIQAGDLALVSDGSVEVQISNDNESYTPLTLAKVGRLYSVPLNNLSETVYLKINASSPLKYLKFTPEQAAVKQVSLSPVESKQTDKLMLSMDDAQQVYGISSSRAISGQDAMLFRFDVADGVTEAKLRLDIYGMYKIEISNDGINFDTLVSVQDGENPDSVIEIPIEKYATSGKTVYLRISCSSNLQGKVIRLEKLRFLTNLTEDWLLQKIETERSADAEITVMSTTSGVDYGEENPESVENKLIDSQQNTRIYLLNKAIPHRSVGKNAEVIYKFTLSGAGSQEFYDLLGIEAPEQVEKFRLGVYVMNGFKLSVSTDKEDWRVVADAGDPNIQSGGNAMYYDVVYTAEEIKAGTVYLRLTVSDQFVEGKTHDALLQSIRFFFN